MKVYPKHPNVLSEGSLKGDKLINPDGEDLGKIEDFIVDTRTGQVIYAILSFGGILGIGNKLFAVPWNAMDLNTDKHAFVLNVDKDKLKNAPGFEKESWPDMTRRDWGESVHKFYGQQPYWAKEGAVIEQPGETRRQPEAASKVRPITSTSAVENQGLIKASALKGEKVRNRAGEDLGKIEEIMIALDTGKIGYMVLSFGGALGIGNKLFAVPWDAMTLDLDKREYILDIPKEKLKQAPGFDKDNWPDMVNPKWDEEIRGFYGVTSHSQI